MTPGFLVQIGGPTLPGSTTAESGPVSVQVAAPISGSGQQVVSRQRGPLLGAADLRLSNRDTLRAALSVLDGDDLDLLLAGFERWGDRVVDRLEGAFAFVVWDPGTGRAAFARDRLGLRSLFQARREGGIVLGSSLPLVQRTVPRAVCREAAVDHLRGSLVYPTKTITAGIERVLPATQGAVQVEGGRVHVRQRAYWSLGQPGVLAGIADADAEEAFRTAFDRSVLACLDRSSGILLSGGLDSSSIAATARVVRPDRSPQTFSVVYDAPEADERRYLDAVGKHLNLSPTRIDGEALSMLAGMDDDLRAVGEPFPTPNLFTARPLYAEVANQGLGSVLDGFAGDNVVGHGDRWLTELALGLRWPTFARELTAAAGQSSRPRRAVWSLLRHYVLSPVASRLRPPGGTMHFARRELAAEPVPPEPWHWRDGDLHRADLSDPVLARAFETAHARASALGVDVRFPFADRALVELCLALPPRQRVRDGLTRSILRRAMGPRLPTVLLQRRNKARLGANFEHALFEREPDTLRRLVYQDVPQASDYLDVGAVHDAYRQALADPARRGTVALALWRAVSLARWLSLSEAGPPSR